MKFIGEMLDYAPWWQWLVNAVVLFLAVILGGMFGIVAWCFGVQLGVTLIHNYYVVNRDKPNA